jgi:CheY-like chemotaxis protein
MQIVLIEDDPQKADVVNGALKELFPKSNISQYRSYQGGLRALIDLQKIDLLVLDMSLPTFDPGSNHRSGRPRPLGGYELMRKARRAGRKIPIIVVTALENFDSRGRNLSFIELANLCRKEFPEMFKGAIYYSQTKASWRDELAVVCTGLE